MRKTMLTKSSLFLCFLAVLLVFSTGCSKESSSTSAYTSQANYYGKLSNKLLFNQEAHDKLVKKLKITTDPELRAILAGQRWLIEFIEKDRNFFYTFTDFLQMINELRTYQKDPLVVEVADALIQNCLSRAQGQLSNIFGPTTYDKWEYISIISLLYDNNYTKEKYFRFYQSQFTDIPDTLYEESFQSAFDDLNYDLMGDYIIDASFLHYIKLRVKDLPLDLPEDFFLDYIDILEDIEFVHSFDGDVDGYYDQNYFVTHIAFVLNDYGSLPMPKTKLAKKTERYLLEQFDTIRQKVDDLDLLAEFVHCLKYFGHGDTPKVREAIQFLLGKQHPDGSWGTNEDFSGDPYDVMHPTWSVLTSIAYPSAYIPSSPELFENQDIAR